MCHDWCAYRARFNKDARHACVVWVGENGAVRVGQHLEAVDLRVRVRTQVDVDAVLLHSGSVMLKLGEVAVGRFAGEHESHLGLLEGQCSCEEVETLASSEGTVEHAAIALGGALLRRQGRNRRFWQPLGSGPPVT